MHLRVVAPEHLREPVLQVLRRQVGVANLSVFPGVALEPAGDEITADLARECANEVIKELKLLDVQHLGAITLHHLDTVLSTRAHQAEDAAEGDPADALVWDELIGRTREESSLSVTFLLFLTLACLLTAIGVVTDSTVTVVGAMVLGPEFGPLAALAALSVALVRRRGGLTRRAALALLIGFPIAVGITALATMASRALGWLSVDSVHNLQEVDFIFQVGPVSFVVALLAGCGRHALPGLGQGHRPGRGVHLRLHRHRGGFRGRGRHPGRLGTGSQVRTAAGGQPGGHRAGRRAGAGAAAARCAAAALGAQLNVRDAPDHPV
jgi:hypothetical protein